jgi:hypothetical protein
MCYHFLCQQSNYRGITVGPVFAKLFAMTIERRLASWAEEHGVKARGQAGFRKNYRTIENIFVLRSLIDKQKQAEQKGGSGKLYCGFPCVSTCCARLTRAPHAFDCGTTFVIEVPPEYNPYKSYVLRGYVSPMP